MQPSRRTMCRCRKISRRRNAPSQDAAISLPLNHLGLIGMQPTTCTSIALSPALNYDSRRAGDRALGDNREPKRGLHVAMFTVTGAIGARMARKGLQMGLMYSGLMHSLGYGARHANVDFKNT